MDRLAGKTAIVTGGSRGIGEAIAEAFAAEGATVVVTSRTQEALDEVAERINEDHPESVRAKACHVGRDEAIEEFFEWVRDEVGRPDVLVNNAGTNPHFGPLMDVEMSAWRKTFEVNLEGYFKMARNVIQPLKDADEPGSVINVTSVMGMKAAPMQGVYGMTKAAVISMTQTLAMELGPSDIRVNAIAPGLVDTEFASILVENEELRRMFTDHSALNRHAQPEEIAGAAVYLASDEASFVTGQTFPVDGGYTVA